MISLIQKINPVNCNYYDAMTLINDVALNSICLLSFVCHTMHNQKKVKADSLKDQSFLC